MNLKQALYKQGVVYLTNIKVPSHSGLNVRETGIWSIT